MRAKLTDGKVARLKPGQTIMDTEVLGFGVRRQLVGTFYFFRGRGPRGQVWITIGQAGAPCEVVTNISFENGRLVPPRILTIECLDVFHARAEAMRFRADIRAGRKPGTSRPDLAQISLTDAIDQYMELYASVNHKRPETTRRYLDVVAAELGTVRLADIHRRDVIATFDRIVKSRGDASAQRAFTAFRAFCRWAIRRDLIERSPTENMEPPGAKLKSRDRVLALKELQAVWKAASALPYPSGPFIQLLALTGQRRSEIASMRWADLDLDTGLWTLPRALTKSDRAHAVPLAPAALTVLKGCKRRGTYVLSGTKGKRPLQGFDFIKQNIDKLSGVKGWTLHDLRRSVATELAGMGVPEAVIGRLLNHAPRGVTASVYNRHPYIAEMRAALQAWARRLLGGKR